MLVANGNENAMAFSFTYDSTRLLYSSTASGSGASGADLIINTTQTNTIQEGASVSKSSCRRAHFCPGTQIVAAVTFFVTNVIARSLGHQLVTNRSLANCSITNSIR